MSTPIERLLDPDRVVLFDGAMGTMLYARGVFINQSYDELNLRSPELVRAVEEDDAIGIEQAFDRGAHDRLRP